jgi:hypothetical protein
MDVDYGGNSDTAALFAPALFIAATVMSTASPCPDTVFTHTRAHTHACVCICAYSFIHTYNRFPHSLVVSLSRPLSLPVFLSRSRSLFLSRSRARSLCLGGAGRRDEGHRLCVRPPADGSYCSRQPVLYCTIPVANQYFTVLTSRQPVLYCTTPPGNR